jgi:hypothetical protein
LSISPDGKWAATGHWNSPVVCIWNLAEGKMQRELDTGPQTRFTFSPASTQFVTARWDAYRFWDLQSQQCVTTLPRIDCPQPDPIDIESSGRVAVASLRPGGLDLVDLASGQSRLHLRRPNQDRPSFLSMDPQGARILEGNVNDNLIAIWDLRELQRELDKLGLGFESWFPPDEEAPSAIAAVTLRGIESWSPPGFIGSMTDEAARQQLEALERTYLADPNSPVAANNLAWALLMAPPALRDVDRALVLAEGAAKQATSETAYVHNTLGTAYYRTGKFDQAIATLRPNVLENRTADLPWDLFVLSMSYSALGNERAAREYLRMGERFMRLDDHGAPLIAPEMLPELESLQGEAAQALDALQAPRADR